MPKRLAVLPPNVDPPSRFVDGAVFVAAVAEVEPNKPPGAAVVVAVGADPNKPPPVLPAVVVAGAVPNRPPEAGALVVMLPPKREPPEGAEAVVVVVVAGLPKLKVGGADEGADVGALPKREGLVPELVVAGFVFVLRLPKRLGWPVACDLEVEASKMDFRFSFDASGGLLVLVLTLNPPKRPPPPEEPLPDDD